jgi:hypothetical protein
MTFLVLTFWVLMGIWLFLFGVNIGMALGAHFGYMGYRRPER